MENVFTRRGTSYVILKLSTSLKYVLVGIIPKTVYLKEDRMNDLSANGMSAIKAARAKRSEAISALTSVPFSINNPDQLKELKSYINDFELHVNQMYLFRAMSTCAKAWGGSLIVKTAFPIPDFANYLLNNLLYIGIAGYILQSFSMTDFYEHVEETKQLYNWALKGNKEQYTSDLDNTEVLSNDDIKKLIKLMAPFCDTEFMIAWDRISMPAQQAHGGWSKTLNSGYTALCATFSFLSQIPKPSTDAEYRIRQLKTDVEQRHLDLSVYNGADQAIKYFITAPTFKTLMASKLQKPLEMVGHLLPTGLLKQA